MSKHIIEFGYGTHSTALCKDGDNLIAAEPLLNFFPEIHRPTVDLNFFHLDEIAIADQDGVCDIYFSLNDLETGFTPLSSSDWHLPGELQKHRVTCLTLDSWISRYDEQGFTKRIDCINCVLNGNTADVIFSKFSFNPRPEVIMIRQHIFPERTFERMEQLGYKCFTSGTWGVGIEAEGLLIAK